MKIRVTQKNIDLGERGCPANCAVSLALKRTFKTDIVAVSRYFCVVEGQEIRFPRKVSDFIHDFDTYATVNPFQFELDYNVNKRTRK